MHGEAAAGLAPVEDCASDDGLESDSEAGSVGDEELSVLGEEDEGEEGDDAQDESDGMSALEEYEIDFAVQTEVEHDEGLGEPFGTVMVDEEHM